MRNPASFLQPARLFGFFLFVGMMAAGYYYNLTFVQLGIEDFGIGRLGLTHQAVARDMAVLALLTCATALLFGKVMQVYGWGRRFRLKLKITFAIILLQTVLTAVIPRFETELSLVIWLGLVSLALGVGVPVMFSMTTDLVPVRQRGAAAAMITAGAYFAAEIFSSEWTFDFFQERLLWLMGIGSVGIGVLAFLKHPWLDVLAGQHTLPEFAQGRYVPKGSSQKGTQSGRIKSLIIIMFGIYFIDSLGFLRLIKVPALMESTWQSSILNDRIFIAGVHVLGAVIAGVLYNALSERHLMYWILGLFSLLHLEISLHIQLTGNSPLTLGMPMLYALAVSLYTVVNFAIWADLSTPDTISFNSALGVALSAWTATFISTGLAVYWQGAGVSLARHIQIVNSIAILFFLAILVQAFIPQKESMS